MEISSIYYDILILSGKGRTGKSTFTASPVTLLNNNITINCDISSTNLYLLLKIRINSPINIYCQKKIKIKTFTNFNFQIQVNNAIQTYLKVNQ